MDSFGQNLDVVLSVDLAEENKFSGRSVEQGLPVSVPIKCLEELLAWEEDPLDCGQLFNVSYVKHFPKENKGKPKTLVCHDMKGGYLEDRFVQGSVSAKSRGYHMQYWSGIDIFVYFSHHFVTVPPVTWINCAHRNGVTVLGTFITEWKEGEQRCKAFLFNENVWKATADQLVKIAKFHGFDGWLINIENSIQLKMIPALKSFLGYLTEEMHKIDENGLIIWYDSVTVNGTLNWQNELNQENKLFFDATDGIFLNYCWNDQGLERSKQGTVDMTKIYVGIDVFGRGCVGGGGFNTSEPLKLVRRHGMSAAIFAPGWVYEALNEDDFYKNNQKFWRLLSDLTPCHPIRANNGIGSDFCPGFGVVKEPGVFRGKHLYNLSSQSLMPTLTSDFLDLSLKDSSHSLSILKHKSRERVRRTRIALETACAQYAVPPLSTSSTSTLDIPARVTLYTLDMPRSESFTVCVRPHENETLPNFELATDIGACVFPHKTTMPFKKEQLHNDCGLISWCIESDKEFTVESVSVILYTRDYKLDFFEIKPGRVPPTMPTPSNTPIKMSLAHWAPDKSTNDKLLFSCLVTFEALPPGTVRSQVSHVCTSKCLENQHVSLEDMYLPDGWSYSDRYRVLELSVPNPKFHGPNCAVHFRVRHLNVEGLILGQGEVAFEYSENSSGQQNQK